MTNAYGKSLDKTYLSIELAERRGFLHRDYIAHCFRWSHVIKFLNEKKRYARAHILDVGCGREAALLTTLYSSRLIPLSYTGIDAGPIKEPSPALLNKFIVNLYQNYNILNVKPLTNAWTEIIMFEVLEHVEHDMGIEVLKHLREFMIKDQTTIFMSTPCYDGVHKAGNHVYEWGFEELREQLGILDFKIINMWGTFASIKDYKYELTKIPGASEIFNQLREYYDTNVLSVIFAPMFPHLSRNCLWQLQI